MATNKSTNTFENGLVRVDNKSKQPKNSLSYSLNSVINNIIKDPSTRTNEKGFDNYLTIKEVPYNILGFIWLGVEEYVFFIKHKEGSTAFNEIWYCNKTTNTNRLVYSNLALNFQDDYEIKGTYRINSKGERVVYWVDGLNDDRVINIDIDNSTLIIDLISVEPSLKKPLIQVEVSTTNGIMTAGQYFFGVSYNIGKDFTTGIFSVTTGISIAKEDYYKDIDVLTQSLQYSDVDGEELNVPTNKAVDISLLGLDTNYTSYNIYVIKSDGSTITVKVIKNITMGYNQTYTYTGVEGEVDSSITLDSVTIDTIKYYASEAIIQKENRLLRGNTKIKNQAINYQSYANQIKVRYLIQPQNVTQLNRVNGINEPEVNDGNQNQLPYYYGPQGDTLAGDGSMAKSVGISPAYLNYTASNNSDNKSFMRDEIYSLGIGFELEDGTETDVFHIPGRALNTFVTSLSTRSGEYNRIDNSTNWDNADLDGQPIWRVRNTATIDDLNTPFPSGELGYWRSSQTYPQGYDYPTNGEVGINGMSYIRHHKIPSDILRPVLESVVTGDPNIINPDNDQRATHTEIKNTIGLTFSNIMIPEELQSRVKKINFFMTPRTDSNKSIISKGLIYATKTDESARRQSQQGNSEYQNLSNGLEFEFVSPEINFKFKKFPLGVSKINVLGVDKGYIIYNGTVTRRAGPGASPPPGSDTWLYNIKLFNSVLNRETGRQQGYATLQTVYNQRAIPKEKYYSRSVDSAIFVDNNFSGTTEGNSLNFSGSQDTSFIKLTDPLRLRESTDPIIADYYPELLYRSGATNYTNINPHLNDPDEAGKYMRREDSYWDTVYYVALKANDTNLYGDMESLTYRKIQMENLYDPEAPSPLSIDIWNGDTYVDHHHFKKTSVRLTGAGSYFAANPEDRSRGTGGTQVAPGYNNAPIFEIGSILFASFMCETDINIRMRRVGTDNTQEYWPKTFISTNDFETYCREQYNQEYYQIEDAYNVQYLKTYVIAYNTLNDLANNIGDRRYSTRIVYSEVQNLESTLDNFRIVKPNNYRDLPLNRGFLSNFFIREDKLYTTTRDSMYMVYTSNQTIKSESSDNITVGTGEFLGIEPTEIISIDGGYGGTSSKFSLTETPYGYLFVDRHKNKVLLFGDSFRDINKNGLDEDFKLTLYNQISDLGSLNEFDNPVNNIGISSIYDPELQRILITKKDYKFRDMSTYKGIYNPSTTYNFGDVYLKDNVLKTFGSDLPLDFNNGFYFENKSFTVSYSPIKDTWISYHSYLPNIYIPHVTDYLKFENSSNIEISNSDTYDTNMPFILEFVFNDNPTITKIFDNIVVNSEAHLNDTNYNEFFDKLVVYNDQQCSGIITLGNGNLTKKEKNWNINQFTDVANFSANKKLFSSDWNDIQYFYPIDKVISPTILDYTKPWYQRGRFRDKYLVCRFTYQNLHLKKIIVNFANSAYRLSQR